MRKSKPKFFSGPPANKATAAMLATAVVTLFWAIAAHTFWKTMAVSNMTLYITASTVFLIAIIGFAVPESAAYTEYNRQRLGMRLAQPDVAATGPGHQSPNGALDEHFPSRALEEQLQRVQERQTAGMLAKRP
jgi:hypothetical protein